MKFLFRWCDVRVHCKLSNQRNIQNLDVRAFVSGLSLQFLPTPTPLLRKAWYTAFLETWTWDSCGRQRNGLVVCVTVRDMICARSSRLPALIYAFLERFHCAAEGLSFAESGSRASCSNLHLARTERANSSNTQETTTRDCFTSRQGHQEIVCVGRRYGDRMFEEFTSCEETKEYPSPRSR